MVTLLSCRAERIAETRLTRIVSRVTPIVGTALVTTTTAKSISALALTVKLVTLSSAWTDRVTIASLASFTRCNFPVVNGTTVTGQALDVGQTRALTCLAVADWWTFNWWVTAQQIAHARRTLLGEGVAEETLLTDVTTESFRVKETLLALASASVTVARSRKVNVVATLARPALTTGHFRITKIIVSADLTSWSGVSFQTLAYHVLSLEVEWASWCVRVTRIDCTRARARPAGNVYTETWVTVKSVQTAVTPVAQCRITAVDTTASSWIAEVGVTVTLATLTRREIPTKQIIQ